MGEQKRTQFAMQAFGFADVFNLKVGDQRVSGHRVELSAPDGPSTGGGKQSVQHIKLIPDDGGPVTVAGSADQLNKKAELRSWEYLAQLHAQRWKGKPFALERARYGELMKRMQLFFSEQGLAVVMIDPPAPPAASRGLAAAPSASSMGARGAVVLAVVIVVAGLLFLWLRQG